MRFRVFVLTAFLLAASPVCAVSDNADARSIVLAAASQGENKSPDAGNKEELSPEQKMARRFPQPIRVGNLIGLPALDWGDATIGFIEHVVRDRDGKLHLIVPYGRWLGWARFAKSATWGKRLVAVPLEAVAILGRQVAVLDMSREDLDAAPTWAPELGQLVNVDEIISIAITRR